MKRIQKVKFSLFSCFQAFEPRDFSYIFSFSRRMPSLQTTLKEKTLKKQIRPNIEIV